MNNKKSIQNTDEISVFIEHIKITNPDNIPVFVEPDLKEKLNGFIREKVQEYFYEGNTEITPVVKSKGMPEVKAAYPLGLNLHSGSHEISDEEIELSMEKGRKKFLEDRKERLREQSVIDAVHREIESKEKFVSGEHLYGKNENINDTVNKTSNALEYTIKKGDKLKNITKMINKKLGTNFSNYQVAKANGILNPDLIKTGGKIIIPLFKNDKDRTESINKGTAAIFFIEDNNEASSDKPLHALDIFSTVKKYDEYIISASKKYGVDSDLIRSIIYLEETQGWYDRFKPKASTIRPMNVHAEKWGKIFSFQRSDLDNPQKNIEIGTRLLKEIQIRVPHFDIKKTGTLYNSLSKEKNTDYGARIEKIYRTKPWLKKN